MIGLLLTSDLRLADNLALQVALEQAKVEECKLMPFLLFTNEQRRGLNHYFSEVAFNFFVKSVRNLDKSMPISTFVGPLSMYAQIVHKFGLTKVFMTRSYTPFGKKRAALLEKALGKGNLVQVRETLFDWGGLVGGSGESYQVYSAFRKAVLNGKPPSDKSVARPIKAPSKAKLLALCCGRKSREWPETTDNDQMVATRETALRMMAKFKFKTYEKNRNSPSIPTTHIGVYLKNGLISTREAWALGNSSGWRDQLVWREFFYYMTDLHGFAQLKPYSGPSWPASLRPPHRPELGMLSMKARFKLWTRAETGHPMVDAGIREMLTTGIMHNRARLVVANYLVQHLRCDWRLGERFFAQNLLDYDPAINCWNWQFIAGTGTDRYKFRPFNPDRQQKKYDPKGLYSEASKP
jgi:deoxyribodipyrimidine photo-lyase